MIVGLKYAGNHFANIHARKYIPILALPAIAVASPGLGAIAMERKRSIFPTPPKTMPISKIDPIIFQGISTTSVNDSLKKAPAIATPKKYQIKNTSGFT